MTAEAGHFPNRVYIGQDGNLHLNGAELLDANEREVGAAIKGMPSQASITSAAGASTGISIVTIQLQDSLGNSVTSPAGTSLEIFLSDASPPTAITATAPSTGPGAATTGFKIPEAAVSKEVGWYVTGATGQLVFPVTDSAKTPYYVNVILPNGQVVTAAAALTYHA